MMRMIYATGGGRMDPPMADGSFAPLTLPLPKTALRVIVHNGEQELSGAVEYAGAAPGMVAGVIQVNVRVPRDIRPADNVPITISVGGYVSEEKTIAVR